MNNRPTTFTVACFDKVNVHKKKKTSEITKVKIHFHFVYDYRKFYTYSRDFIIKHCWYDLIIKGNNEHKEIANKKRNEKFTRLKKCENK